MPPGALVSCVHIIATQRVLRARVDMPGIRDEYERDGLRMVAARHDLPPWRLLCWMHPEVKYYVSDELKDEYTWALENDVDSPLKYAEMQRAASEFEHTVAQWLDAVNVTYRTQEQLVDEQTAAHGRAVATPDFLFDKPLKIAVTQHGHRRIHTIHWIDCKNYMLFDASFIVTSSRRQAEKYRAMFGEGAFVYRWGFTTGVKLPCLLLDWGGDAV